MQVMQSNALAQLIVQRIMELESTTNVEAIPLEHVEMLQERMSEQSPEPENRASNWHLESEDYCRREEADEESGLIADWLLDVGRTRERIVQNQAVRGPRG